MPLGPTPRERRSVENISPQECEKLLAINKDTLEDECALQPEIFYRVAKELPLAVSRRDEAKQLLEEEEARADERIRLVYEKSGEKVTETAIKSAKVLDRKVIDARNNLSRLALLASEWAAIKESFQQRSYALNHLVDLYVASYYGDTSNTERKVRSTNTERDAETVKAMRARRADERARSERTRE